MGKGGNLGVSLACFFSNFQSRIRLLNFLAFDGWNCLRGTYNIIFAIGRCPLTVSSYITPKLTLKSLPQNRSSTYLSLVHSLIIFLSAVCFIADIHFPSHTFLSVCIALIIHWKDNLHDSSLQDFPFVGT